MLKKLNIKYNPFFLTPFLLWVIAGGILLLIFTREELFFAVNRNYTDWADDIMYYTTLMGTGEFIAFILLSLMVIFPAYRNKAYFLLALFCNVIPFLFQQILKTVFDHQRPMAYYHNRYWVHHLADWPLLLERSFPSGHSEGAFSFFCFLSLLLPARHRKFGFLFFLLSLSVCYSRMYLAAHFFDDIYLGSIIGAVLTTAIYSALCKYRPNYFVKTSDSLT